jgi:hypothetical protein
MALYDQIVGNEISVHKFGAALRLWLAGGITDERFGVEPVVEPDTTVPLFPNFSAASISNIQAVKTKFQAQSGLAAKVAFVLKIEGVLILWVESDFSKAEGHAVVVD